MRKLNPCTIYTRKPRFLAAVKERTEQTGIRETESEAGMRFEYDNCGYFLFVYTLIPNCRSDP